MLMGMGSSVFAQDNAEPAKDSKESTAYRHTPSPDFPGALVLEYGINYFDKNSPVMDTKPWGSPTLNLYYMYNARLGDSRFSVNIGVGVGSEKYTFNAPITFTDSLQITVIDSIKNIPYFSNISALKKISNNY